MARNEKGSEERKGVRTLLQETFLKNLRKQEETEEKLWLDYLVRDAET